MTFTTFDKALVGGLTALLGALGTAAVADGISLAELFTSLATGLGAFGGVYGVANKPANDSGD